MSLKKVVGEVWANGRDNRGNICRMLHDKLECGHTKQISFDKFGRRITVKSRRCHSCDTMKAQMRPDFSQGK